MHIRNLSYVRALVAHTHHNDAAERAASLARRIEMDGDLITSLSKTSNAIDNAIVDRTSRHSASPMSPVSPARSRCLKEGGVQTHAYFCAKIFNNLQSHRSTRGSHRTKKDPLNISSNRSADALLRTALHEPHNW